MDRFTYAVAVTKAPEGGFVVTCRDLPALVTQGNDLAHALAQAVDAMEEVLVTLTKLCREIPIPTPPLRGEQLVSARGPRNYPRV